MNFYDMKSHRILIWAGLLLGAAMAAGGCQRQDKDDESPITLLVALDGNEEYFRTVTQKAKDSLGIDIEILYQTSADPIAQLKLDVLSNQLPADIILSEDKIPAQMLKGCCVDLMAHSHLTSYYSYEKIKECSGENGEVFQLPLSSRLIGINYNATLMEEMGWELPKNFEQMVELKKKCKKAGYTFAVANLYQSKFAFHYLFNIMGTQWLSSIDGTQWLDEFTNGTQTIDAFKEKSVYFKKWVENGLFDDFYTRFDHATERFGTCRTLFCYDPTKTSAGFTGTVFDKWVTHKTVTRNDKHKIMPWISEDGSNNCFTRYDNCWVSLNKSLLGKNKKKKLENALRFIEYFTTDECTKLLAGVAQDVFPPFNNYQITPDRLYYEYADKIRAGFMQPFFINRFSTEAIVATGSEAGSYLLNAKKEDHETNLRGIFFTYNPNASFDSVFQVLSDSREEMPNEVLCKVEEELDYEQTARVSAIIGALAMQDFLDKDYGPGKYDVNVSLMPYINDIRDMQPWHPIAVQSTLLHKGMLRNAYSLALIPFRSDAVRAISMSGAQIKQLMEKGFDPSYYFKDGSFDNTKYGPYPYVCVTKGGFELEDDKEYLVAVSNYSVNSDTYFSLAKEKRIVIHFAKREAGIPMFFSQHPVLNKKTITW